MTVLVHATRGGMQGRPMKGDMGRPQEEAAVAYFDICEDGVTKTSNNFSNLS
jgi:hypothetical protein